MRNNLIQIPPIIFQQLIKTYQLSLEIKISQLLLYFVPVIDRVYILLIYIPGVVTGYVISHFRLRIYIPGSVTGNVISHFRLLIYIPGGVTGYVISKFKASDLYPRRRYRVYIRLYANFFDNSTISLVNVDVVFFSNFFLTPPTKAEGGIVTIYHIPQYHPPQYHPPQYHPPKGIQYNIKHTAFGWGCYGRLPHSEKISPSTSSWVIFFLLVVIYRNNLN